MDPALSSAEAPVGTASTGGAPVPLTITLLDAEGDPVDGLVVSLSSAQPGVTLTQPSQPTDANGQATGAVISRQSGLVIVAVRVHYSNGDSELLDQRVEIEFVDGPTVLGPARYRDVNFNGQCDAGDELVIAFDRDIVVVGAVAADLELPVSGDALGAGATLAGGPAAHELTVTLGSGPGLRTRGAYSSADRGSGAPSGVDVRSGGATSITGMAGGLPALPTQATDVLPGWVSGGSHGVAASAAVALGDVDGDGDLDALIGRDGGSDGLLLGDGHGGFVDSGQTFGTTERTLSVALADVDRDGDLDAWLGRFDAADLLLLGDGTGVLSDSGQTLGSAIDATIQVAFADVDRDGDLDLVSAGSSGQPLRVYTNGAGVFSDSGQLLGTHDSRAIALGDIDRDGDLDLIEAVAAGLGNRVYRNSGGTFSPTAEVPGFTDSRAVALFDLDRDGELDLFVGTAGGGQRVFLGDGNGAFTDTGQSLGSTACAALQPGDFDRDGDVDMLVVEGGVGWALWLNGGAGDFTESGEGGALPAPRALAAGDLDRDGDPDLLIVQDQGHPDRVLLHSGSGTFGAIEYLEGEQSLGSGTLFSLGLGDLDGDAAPDLAVVQFLSGVSLHRNDGAGLFSSSLQVVGGTFTSTFEFGDVDGDGDEDLVVAAGGSPGEIFFNDGSGTMVDVNRTFGGAVDTNDLVLADLDGDGDLDIVTATGSYLSSPNGLFSNNGAGVFSPRAQSFGSVTTTKVVAGDLNGDGSLDLVFANGDFLNGRPNTVFFNDGSGSFTDSGQALGNDQTFGVLLRDLDRDGDLDLVERNLFDATRILWNDGAGVFSDSGQSLLPGDAGQELGAVDADGDGDLDLVLVYGGGGLALFENNGSGAFTPSSVTLAPTLATLVRIADLDRDGDADLAVSTGQLLQVLRRR